MLGLDPGASFDFVGPTVTLDAPPPPEAGAGLLSPLVFLLLVVSLGFVFRHRRMLKDRGARGLRTLALGAALSNGVLDLGSMLVPTQPDSVSILVGVETDRIEVVGLGPPGDRLQTVRAAVGHEFPLHAIR